MLEAPRCYERKCKHYKGVAQPDGTEISERYVCDAFPNGIPSAIALGNNLHLVPVPGDNGITYEQGEMT